MEEVFGKVGELFQGRLEALQKLLKDMDRKMYSVLSNVTEDSLKSDAETLKMFLVALDMVHKQIVAITQILNKFREEGMLREGERALVASIVWHLRQLPDEVLLDVSKYVREKIEEMKTKRMLEGLESEGETGEQIE